LCDRCDNPALTVDDVLATIARKVETYGWAITCVGAQRRRAPWAYTVGLTALGHPELLVTGLTPQRAARLLNGMATHVLHAEAPPAGDRFTFGDFPRMEAVEVAEPHVHLPVAVRFGGPAVRGLQLVRCDDRGTWTWEPGFRSRRWPQPVLGPRTDRPSG
jgi:hypothetical protein